MHFLSKIFGNRISKSLTPNNTAYEEHLRMVKVKTDMLWKYLEETMEFYDLQACQCAFPRYRQMVALDCVDYGKSFYASETEGFISISTQYFDRQILESGVEAVNELWTCKKCGSTYDYGWADFSIHVNRTFLKIRELKTKEIGAGVQSPLPLFVGLFGHTFPDRTIINPVDFETYSTYIRELKGEVE